MIALIVLALTQIQAGERPASRPREAGFCRGIHMPNGAGGVNVLWTTIRGPEARLAEIRDRMRGIGAAVEDRGGELLVSYTDRLDARAIGGLLNAIDAGDFGPVSTEDFAMSLDTLPADRCIRFRD